MEMAVRPVPALNVLNNECMVTERHRQTFGPGSIMTRLCTKSPSILTPPAMLDEVDFQISGQWVVPVGKGPDRKRAANRVADSPGALWLSAEGLFTQPVNGRRTDADEPRA